MKTIQPDAEVYYNLTTIKKMGFSLKEIETLLGEPDKLKVNPMYKSSAPSKLWLKEKVNAALPHVSDKTSKREASKKATSTKFSKTLELTSELNVQLTEHLKMYCVGKTKAELHVLAINHYNILHQNNYVKNQISDPVTDTEFLARITTNYLRHVLTDYDANLELLAGKVGKAAARKHMQNEVQKFYHSL